jgi:protein O-mannosyl-transferase
MTSRLGSALVVLIAVILYLPSVRNGFAYDDNLIIRLDERIHDLRLLPDVLTAPYWPIEDLGLYRPLVTMSYAVDWSMSGGRPGWFHFMNVIWNAAACLLVFRLLLMLTAPAAALAGALLFTVHPVHVEAVANIVGRAELMAAVFSLGALVLWARAPAEHVSRSRLAAIGACFALALLSKESVIVLPALLALTDAARGVLTPTSAREWLHSRMTPMLVLGAVAGAYLVVRVAVLGSWGPGLLDPTLEVTASVQQRILTALQAWPEYARLLLYPRTLLADYGPPYFMPAIGPTPAALAGLLILAVLAAAGTLAFLLGSGRLAFVLLFMPVALLPVSNLLIPIGVVVAERALYLPSVALAAAAAFAYAAAPRYVSRRTAAVAAFAVLTAGSVRTLHRIPEWRSTDAILGALERDRPGAFRAHWHFARVAAESGQPAVALQRYASAVTAWPYREGLTLEAAAYAARVGDVPLAARITDFGSGRWPDHVGFMRLQAALQLDGGDTVAAGATITRGLQLAPQDTLLNAMQRAIAGSGTE